MPDADFDSHEMSATCWCQPEVESHTSDGRAEWLITHRAPLQGNPTGGASD